MAVTTELIARIRDEKVEDLRADMLDSAVRIGHRLHRDALWTADRCTWMVTTLDRSNPWSERGIRTAAGPYVYNGSSGIALFLTELHRHTGEAAFARLAEGALRHALFLTESLPPSIALYSGLTGMAMAFARHGTVAKRSEFLEQADDLSSVIIEQGPTQHDGDFMSGSAGAIPVLLQLAQELQKDALTDLATAFGDRLIQRARMWPIGWGWETRAVPVSRDLTGLAHGAAGYGAALLELFIATGNSAFRFAAEQAFEYEQQFFSPAKSNWPDFRHQLLAKAMSEGAEGQETIRNVGLGELAPETLRYAVAWCHGAPGIGLTRLRAWELLGHAQYRQDISAAIVAISNIVEAPLDYSLCHGAFGCDAFLLCASQVLEEPALAHGVVRRIEQALDQGRGIRVDWPSGTIGNVPDPSLMTGLAGVGYHLLSVLAPDTPSVLLPTTSLQMPSTDSRSSAGEVQCRAQHVNHYFSTTLRVINRLREVGQLEDAGMGALDTPLKVAEYLTRLRHDSSRSATVSLLNDTSGPELARFELTLNIADYADTIVHSAMRKPTNDVDWDNCEIGLAEIARVVNGAYDVANWLEHPALDWPRQFVTPRGLLVWRTGDKVAVRELPAFSALVMQEIQQRTTIAALVRLVLQASSVTDNLRIQQLVTDQVQAAYAAGLIRLDPSNDHATMNVRSTAQTEPERSTLV